MQTWHIPPALIPERSTPDGPVTTHQLRRTVIGYLTLVATGTAIARRAANGRAANLGVGLVAPVPATSAQANPCDSWLAWSASPLRW